MSDSGLILALGNAYRRSAGESCHLLAYGGERTGEPVRFREHRARPRAAGRMEEVSARSESPGGSRWMKR
jgi:hypothetical protein